MDASCAAGARPAIAQISEAVSKPSATDCRSARRPWSPTPASAGTPGALAMLGSAGSTAAPSSLAGPAIGRLPAAAWSLDGERPRLLALAAVRWACCCSGWLTRRRHPERHARVILTSCRVALTVLACGQDISCRTAQRGTASAAARGTHPGSARRGGRGDPQTIVAVEAGDDRAVGVPGPGESRDRLGVTVEELFGSSGTASTPANQVKELS